MKTICTPMNIVCLSALIPAMMLSGCGDLAIVKPTDQQVISGPVSPAGTTLEVPIVVDFTGSTSARNIVLDNLNITTAPAAAFITTPGAGQKGWDQVSGKYAVTPGTHSLTASAEYLDYSRTTQRISKTVTFSATLPADLWPPVAANLITANVGQHVTFTITVHNLGPGDAQNVSVLFWTAVPATFFAVQPQANSGFTCGIAPGYAPARFGMQCDGGTVAKQDTKTISVELSFPSSGSKVLAVFADPANTIIETDKANNNTNAMVMVQ